MQSEVSTSEYRGHPRLDVSRYPIVVSTMPKHSPSPEALMAHFDEWREVLARGQPYLSVVDMTQGVSSSPVVRKMSAAFMKEQEEATKRWCLGHAYAVSSPIMRGVLTATFWAMPPVKDYVIVATLDAALAWARERVARG